MKRKTALLQLDQIRYFVELFVKAFFLNFYIFPESPLTRVCIFRSTGGPRMMTVVVPFPESFNER